MKMFNVINLSEWSLTKGSKHNNVPNIITAEKYYDL